MRRLVACLVVCLAAVGCGGGSEVPPVVEYNAAQEAYTRNEKVLSEIQNIIRGLDKKDPDFNAWIQKEKDAKEVLTKLRQQVRAAYNKM